MVGVFAGIPTRNSGISGEKSERMDLKLAQWLEKTVLFQASE